MCYTIILYFGKINELNEDNMKSEMYDFHKPEQKNNWWFKARKNIVKKIMNRYIYKKNNAILEVGCGYGIMTEILTSFGQVEGLEPYSDCYNYLKQNIPGKYSNTDFFKFKPTKKYDVLALFDVLEHIEDDKKVVKKINSLLKKKGMVVLTVPAYMFLWSHHDDLNNHYRRYVKKDLTKLFQMNGFKIKKLTYFNTILFPLAYIQKITQNKNSKPFNPNNLLNKILYSIFNQESNIVPVINLPFGVSLLLIAEKE